MRNRVFPEVFFENTVFFFCSVSISDTFVDGLVGFGCMGLYLSPSFYSFTPLTSVPAACHYGTTV